MRTCPERVEGLRVSQANRSARQIGCAAECAIGPAAEKSDIDEVRQYFTARSRIEAPQPARLRQGQRQSGHLAKFSTHTFRNQGFRVLLRDELRSR
jgi:hypothetical protein